MASRLGVYRKHVFHRARVGGPIACQNAFRHCCDSGEADLLCKEGFDRNLICRVENRRGCPARLYHFTRNPGRWKQLFIGLFEVEFANRREIERREPEGG